MIVVHHAAEDASYSCKAPREEAGGGPPSDVVESGRMSCVAHALESLQSGHHVAAPAAQRFRMEKGAREALRGEFVGVWLIR